MRRALHLYSTTTSTTAASATTARSPWRSPVPYMFGGMAAMLGLIAFALLILACSYFRISGNDDNEDGEEREVEVKDKGLPDFDDQEKIVVIMAGDDKPSFLATPSALIFSNPIIASLDEILQNKSSIISKHAPHESGSNTLDIEMPKL